MYIGSPDTPSLGMASSKVSPNHSSVQKSRQSNVVPLQRQGLGPNSLVPGGQGEHGCWGDIGMLRVPDSSQRECSDLGGGALQKPLNTVCLFPGHPGGGVGLLCTSGSAPCTPNSTYANKDLAVAPSASRSPEVAAVYSSIRRPMAGL